MHPFPVLTRKIENQTKLQIRMLQKMISESQEISSAASIALETTHALIASAKSAIKRLKGVILDVGGDIQSKQRLVHPIHRLPCELVVQVLRLAVQVEHEEQERSELTTFALPDVRPSCTLRAITNVCRAWPANLGSIWKSHFIDGSLKALKANLAGINPDILLIAQNDNLSLTNPYHDRYFSKLLSPPQIVHVSFESDVQPGILPFCPLSLHLSNRRRFDAATLGQKFSSLQSLTCTDTLPVINDRLPSLTILRIRFGDTSSQSWGLPLDSLSQTLTNTPNITILEIYCPMPGRAEIPDRPILLASLTTLCLRLTFPKSLPTHFGTLLRCPKLTRLEISLETSPFTEPAEVEEVEELLNVGKIGSQLTSLRILGPKRQVEFARFPRLINLETLIMEGGCARTFIKGLLCTRLEDEHPLICPVLSRVCIKESMISGDTIENAIHPYRQERAVGEGGALPKMSVEVYDCPNVSVAQMKDLRRIRE